MLITIATYFDPFEAHIIKTKLEAKNISVFVSDYNTSMVAPYLLHAIGGG